jgi:hypothetical protein
VLLAVVLTLVLTGCFTGERPSFQDADAFPPGSTTGDPAIDAVLAKFDAVTTGPATAKYSVLTKYGNLTSKASVALSPGKRNIIVENTRYIQNDTGSATCTVDNTVPCSTGWDPTRISDTGLTVDFYATDTAKRLRRDAQAKVGPSTAHDESVADQPVTCVDVPLTGGTARYCALANGMVAILDDGDVRVALTGFSAKAADAQFTIPA